MIKIIVSMLTDLATFTVLWIIQLFIFACIGYLIFGELYEYRDLQNTLIMLLESSLGQWDFNIYNDLKIGPMYGVGYHIIVITVNMILLLNLVIAILTETYVRFSKVKLGLYYDGVVDAISNFKYDKKYGAMITAIPPFNVLMFFATPLFLLTKNPRKLKKINNVLTQITYFPIAAILITIFVSCNICMVPFAYLFALLHKGKLCFMDRIHRDRKQLMKEFTFFAFFGILLLLLSQIKDAYYFAKQLFNWKMEKLDHHKVDSISITAFTTLEGVVKQIIKDLELKTNQDQSFVRSIEVTKKLRDALEIPKCLQILIFGKFSSIH
jgi:hypothetical protein